MINNSSEKGKDFQKDPVFDVEKILAQLKHWSEKLIDISKRNPLLGLNRAGSAKLQVKDPLVYDLFKKLTVDDVELYLPFVKKVRKNKTDVNLFSETELGEKEEYKIEKGDLDLAFDTLANLKKKIRRIYDNSKATVEERGVVTLYATFGTINWQDDVLQESVSPIVLVPCELIYKGPNAPLKIHMADEEIQINPAVIYYFKEKHKIEFPDFTKDLEEGSLKEIFKKVAECVKDQQWKVTEEVWIGTFTFESLVLYQDLKLLSGMACLNPLVAAFAHASNNHDVSEALGDDLDSLETPKVVPTPILPADSSQLKALTYVNGNQHLVIHGPPGTGKSQTISNIIASALGQNKKVLFVSAKMAALNVVFDRLKAEGLGQFCLEAHGTKSGKLKIIEELKRTIESEDVDTVTSIDQEIENLKNTRQKLNEYVLTLHEIIQPFGISIFRGIGQFEKLYEIIDVKLPIPWKDVLEVSNTELNDAIDALSNIAQMSELFNGRKKHSWRGFINLEASIQVQEQIEKDLQFILQTFTDLDGMLIKIKKILPKQDFSFEELFNLVPILDIVSKIKKLPEKWWSLEVNVIQDKEKLFGEASLLAKELREKKELFKTFCSLSPSETISLLKEADISFKPWSKRITITYYKWKKDIKARLNKNIKLGYREISNCLSLSKRLFEIEKWFEKNIATLSQEVLPEKMFNVEILQEVSKQCNSAIVIRNSSLDYDWKNSKITNLDTELINTAAGLSSTIQEVSQPIKEASERMDLLWPDGFVEGCKTLKITNTKFAQRADELLENIGKLKEWVILQRAIMHAENIGLQPFIDNIKNNETVLLPLIFKKRFLKLWINTAIDKSKILSEFSAMKQQELIEKLRILDERIRRLSNEHIGANASLNAKRVKSAHTGLGNGSEIGILRFEMQKRKRIKPLRKLFSEIPHVLQALKPCMLMSPISVSTYLKPGTFHFDLVIFDEASQLPTPEAIPSILRASQVVVAGDPNQLPPTSFFNSTLMGDENDDYDGEQFSVALESLLDDCVAAVPTFQEAYLKWHYRSRDERLVNFSNHYFYENKLVTFPSVCTDNKERGLKLEYVENGVWDRGKSRTNRIEARRAAKLIIEHFEKFPERSLGVVALNNSQKEAIEDALNDELSQKPELQPFFDTSRKEAFFVKSLESVQGDERDVIIISVGYGKAADGSLTMNFGPLNAEGGWRRLNVLVTRAKWQIILLTSLRSSELGRINDQNRGALSLKNFIEYVERGGSLPPDPVRLTNVETNDFEDSIREVLVDEGYSVDAQVGVGSFRIDLAIRDPKDDSKYLIGIECDGATYHSSRVARDRDILREEVLKGMGWKLHRVWSTEWFNNREMAIKLMLSSVGRALSKEEVKPVHVSVTENKELELKQTPVPQIKGKYKYGIPYCKYSRNHRKETLMKKGNIYQLGRILIDVIESEGPIHDDILNERLKEIFGVEKIGNNIRTNVEDAIKNEMRRGFLERKKPFTWSKGGGLDTFRILGDGVKRPICHISSQEIAMAILYLAEDQFGIMREQIPQAINKVFEIARMDTDEIDRVREVTDNLIDAGKLVVNGNQVNISI
jgi:superfamily I DNA and/or RNA helicase/very-short-patch-repair endonuclease